MNSMVKELIFFKDPHEYYLREEGKEDIYLPHFSEIAGLLDDFSKVHPVTLERRGQEGTDVHATVKLWLDGTLDKSRLAQGNKIALELLWNWQKNEGSSLGKLVEWEKPVYHEKLLYATTPDLVYKEFIVDVKTRKFLKHKDPVQLEAQIRCFPEFPPKKGWILFLDIENRKYTFQRAYDKQAWGMFRKLLDKWRSDREIEEMIRPWKMR